jgi:uncharacterized protein YbjQ (UPF0145 family)
MDALIGLGSTVLLLLATYFVGNHVERKHIAELQSREARSRKLPVVTFEALPEGWEPERSGLVTGSVVVSVDYFKRFLAGLRGIVGGRIKSYEPLLDRARREAMLRMIESARGKGFDAVLNVRLETSRLASSRRDGKGIAGVEMLAFGTGIRRARRAAVPPRAAAP